MAIDPATATILISLLGGALSGLGGKKGQTSSTFNKNQLGGIDEILNSIRGMRGGAQDITQNQGYQQGQGFLSSLFNDQDFFNRFEAPAFRQFNEEIAPGIANRFASMGSGGSLGSTGFRNQIAREGGNLATNLAAQRGNMQQQAVPQLLGYSQQPFSNLLSLYQHALQPTQNVYQQPSAGFFGPIAASLAGGAATGLGNQLGQQMGQGGNTSMPGMGMTTEGGWNLGNMNYRGSGSLFPGQNPSTR